METNQPFIFYLTLEENLPDQFYVFDSIFKEYNYILVPIRVDQLQKIVATTDQNHVIVISCITNFRSFHLFNEKVRGILKYLLKSKRISFFELSSFSRLNDSKIHLLTKNYYFMKTPLDARALAERMITFQEQKSSSSDIWPGGHRSISGVA